MASVNPLSQTAQQPDNHAEHDCLNCRKRYYGGTNLVECLMGAVGCKCAMDFGNVNFCNHPSTKQFVNSNQPQQTLKVS